MSAKNRNRHRRIAPAHHCAPHVHGSIETPEYVNGKDKVILIGNPNVGKSVIFGHLTGSYVTVSNYPGTTVEITTGSASFNGKDTLIVDTPGVNNLTPMSEDEIVTRNIILREKPRTVVQVADAKNLRRSLFLTLQLIEMGLPIVLNINMVDEARSRGIRIDEKLLAEKLGIPVIKTVATRRQGIGRLINTISAKQTISPFAFRYSKEIETAIKEIEPLLPETPIRKRALALMILSEDTSLNDWLFQHLSSEKIAQINQICHNLKKKYNSPLSFVITQQRMAVVQELSKEALKEEKITRVQFLSWLDQRMVHPLWGWAFVLVALFLMYEFVGVFGAGTLVDFFEGTLFGQWLLPPTIRLVQAMLPWSFAQDFLVGEYGILSMALTYAVAIVLPIVATFFLAFAFLEDSGYLPRLSIVVNRIFRAMGLNGKAVLPMILGLGCDTMATLTTRILDSKKERIIVTLLLALGIPCSAQLGVILGMLGGVSSLALVIWAATVALVLLLVGFLSSQIIPGEKADFILEIPPLRWPKMSNILIKTVARIEWYLKEAVPLFILGTLILFFLDRFHMLEIIEQFSAPVVQKFLQLPPKATEAFLVGFLRRDYGVAGLFALAQEGALSTVQIIVSLVTITLFVPCIANFFIIIKERGWKTALAIVGFIVPFAFLVGGTLNFILRTIGFGG